ncbi:hypothetical protein OQA88_855 [Cercophora sp. LCS_1]
MVCKSRSVGSAQRVLNLANGGGNSLSKRNLEQFTLAARRQEARRRGRSTPPPEPDLHDWDDSASSHIRKHPRNYHRPNDGFQEPLVVYTDSEPNEVPIQPGAAPTADKPIDAGGANREQINTITSPLVVSEVDGQELPGYKPTPRPNQDREPVGTTAHNGHPDDETVDEPIGAEHADSMTDRTSSKDTSESMDKWKRIGYDMPKPQKPRKPRQTKEEKRAVEAEPRFPPNFPTYRMTQSLNEAAAYLANASYFVSLGGPPVADLKYGIIAVPVGEESLLFGPQTEHVVSQSFLDAIDDAKRDYFRAEPMHDPDEDSEEFVRYRVQDRDPGVDDDSDISISDFRGVEVAHPQKEDVIPDVPDEETIDQDDDVEMDPPEVPEAKRKAAGRAPKRKPTRESKQSTTNRAATAKPQGVVKPRRSLRNGGTPVPPEAVVQAPGRRTRSGKK